MLPVATVTFGTTPAEITCEVETATIRHGRDDPSSDPDADAATLGIFGLVPPEVDIGTPITVQATTAGVTSVRFVGKVTDVGIGWDSPDRPIGQIIAVGALADMGRRVVGDAPFPQETDGARANRAIALAGVPTDAARTDLGTLQVLPRDVDAQPALQVAQDAADDGGGMLWMAKDGAVLYADADHRRAAQVKLALDPCAMPLTVTWVKNLEGLVNDVRVRYGTAPEGGDQPEYHATDPVSIAARGTFASSITTRLADAAAATSRAGQMLARQAQPAWVLSGIAIYLELIGKLGADVLDDATATNAVLALEMHDLVSVTGMPAGSPYTSATLWVEGWTETITWSSWRISYAVSAYCRTSAEPRWDDVPAATTWDTIADITWDQATCLPPAPPSGTWNDIPSTLRWDQIPAGTTWDTWS